MEAGSPKSAVFSVLADTVVQQQGQEGILNSAHGQEFHRIQDGIVVPVHPPVIVDLSNEEDEDEDEEEDEVNNISVTLERTAADIEEERAIKEVCYKSGEYYRVHYPQILQSTEIVPPSPCLESEQLPMDTVEPDSWTGSSCVPSVAFPGDNNMRGERETSGMNVSMKCISRRNDKPYENKDISVTLERTAADIEEERAIKEVCYKSGKYDRSDPFMNSTVASIVKILQSTEIVPPSPCLESEQLPMDTVEPDSWTGIPTSYSKVKPNYQQNYHRRDDETSSSIRSVRQSERNIYFNSSEPQKSAYVFYRNGRVMQEPMYNGTTGFQHRNIHFEETVSIVEMVKDYKCFNVLKILFFTFSSSDKYYSASHNTPPWRKRNPHAKTFSKFKTTSQGQDMEKKKKGKNSVFCEEPVLRSLVKMAHDNSTAEIPGTRKAKFPSAKESSNVEI
ncbi:UNVERIFIED_CONTAM: hypothetical protein H355_006567 [Colinus virginianus]|nr:hypothetical protein H355_006567 [Colinus virginianus]